MKPPAMETGGIKTDMLYESNPYIWKQRMELVLMICGVEGSIITTNTFHSGTVDYGDWTQKAMIAHVIVGLYLPGNILEQTRETASAMEDRDKILNIFQCHALLNKQKARRDSYAVNRRNTENIISVISRVEQLEYVLKSVGVDRH